LTMDSAERRTVLRAHAREYAGAGRAVTDPDAARWAANLAPLAEVIAGHFRSWLPRADYPSRYGAHDNSAIGLSRLGPRRRGRRRDAAGRAPGGGHPVVRRGCRVPGRLGAQWCRLPVPRAGRGRGDVPGAAARHAHASLDQATRGPYLMRAVAGLLRPALRRLTRTPLTVAGQLPRAALDLAAKEPDHRSRLGLVLELRA
jgi:Protein of unknown function (DUF2891)